MSPVKLVTAAALFALAAPLVAQSSTVQPEPPLPPTRELPQDRGYDKETERTRRVNAVEAPVTAELNSQVAARTPAAGVSAADEAQYEVDVAGYRAQVEANARATMDDQDRYARQQRAYGDAMTAWRVQARDCQKGSKAACNAPPPNPADFY